MATGSCCPDSSEQSAHTTASGRSGLRRSGRPSDMNEAPLLSVSFSVFFLFFFHRLANHDHEMWEYNDVYCMHC
ncbi:hypothetical protein DAI22_05g200900 [Oryza sativa Japonica Group]|nr:hypothetical protein DAI22_05g200900 [Oryza sativa Japonica Group]